MLPDDQGASVGDDALRSSDWCNSRAADVATSVGFGGWRRAAHGRPATSDPGASPPWSSPLNCLRRFAMCAAVQWPTGAVSTCVEFLRDRAQALTVGISSHRVVNRGDRRSCLVAQLRSSVSCAAVEALPMCTELRPNRRFSSSMAAISAERSRCGCSPGASETAENRSSSPCCWPAGWRSTSMTPALT